MKRSIQLLVVALSVFCNSLVWGAAIPAQEYIPYSQTSGALTVGSAYTIRFSLWDSPTVGSGTMIWSEEKSITVSANNTIVANLGTVKPLASVDFSKQYWVQADNHGTTYTMIGASRLPFRMEPYAEYALVAASVSGANITGAISGAKISGNIAGNAANVTGVVGIANGGTGASTAAGALTKLGAVSASGSYTNPAWIKSLDGSKITGNITATNITANGSMTLSSNMTTYNDITFAPGWQGKIHFSDGTTQTTAAVPMYSYTWYSFPASQWLQISGAGDMSYVNGTDLDTPMGMTSGFGLSGVPQTNGAVLVYVDDGHGAQQLPCTRQVSGGGQVGTLQFRYVFETSPQGGWLVPVVGLQSGTWSPSYIINTYLPTLKWRAFIIRNY